jgi:starch synthase
MHIVQIASEITPIAKVGGLADVMAGLSRELKLKGHTVDILLPKYDCLDDPNLKFSNEKTKVKSFFQGAWHDNTIVKAPLNGDLTVTFIDAHHPARFFQRGQIYGLPDDIDRFLYFSRACLDYLKSLKDAPDIIHLHDWETAGIALLIQDPYFKKHFSKTKVVFTIHNMDYQGQCATFNLDMVGLQGSSFKEKLKHDNTEDINLVKGGIIFSDWIVTVSPSYAQEVLTPIGGKGLEDTLKQNKSKFSGILNGIDYTFWNTETDRYISQKYSPCDKNVVIEKQKNKWQLIDELGMKKSDTKPLMAAIARLVPQKGLEALQYMLTRAQEVGAQYIILGTAPDPEVHKEFATLEQHFKKHPDIRIVLKTEEGLAHKLYAASDMFIVPSLFEPCGLTQMIAMRYGSVPIVRKTGGLQDTVFDVDTNGRPFEEKNGFVFDAITPQGINSAADRAIKMYKENPTKWHNLMLQGMHFDHSWAKPADCYLDIYRKIL